jgi:hypothetical protein
MGDAGRGSRSKFANASFCRIRGDAIRRVTVTALGHERKCSQRRYWVRISPESRHRPAWLQGPLRATCGLIAPQQTKPLFDDLVRAAEQREREATRGHYPLSGPDFHRLDRTSLRLVHSLDYLVGERA